MDRRRRFAFRTMLVALLVAFVVFAFVVNPASDNPVDKFDGFLAFLAAILVVVLLSLELSGRLPNSTKGSEMTEWWYNHKTKQVEEGPQSLGSDRDGPYASREEAERAPEIAAKRASEWAAEDD